MTYPTDEARRRHEFVPYSLPRPAAAEQARRSREFLASMAARRSVRQFSSEPVPRELVVGAIAAAATAPSGAHRQPWRFVLIGDQSTKQQIREAAEAEERVNYEGGRLPEDWQEALAPLGTSWEKPYLEQAPWLVIVFEERYGVLPDGSTQKNYYVKESVGIACGIFIAALQQVGLATLTHTPSPMAFLAKVLGRPRNERPFVLFPVGYPSDDCVVPALVRKPLSAVLVEE